jgi:hypothetical protein
MTSKERHTAERDRLLEQILYRVQSIDRNVEEILDRVSDHIDDTRLDLNWRHNGYDLGEHHDEDAYKA